MKPSVFLGSSLCSLLIFLPVATPLGRAAPSARSAAWPRTLDTPREFPNIKTRAEWQERAREIRAQILVSCGLWPLPKKSALRPVIFGKVERDGYSIAKVYCETLPGFYLAGNLYRPS